MGHRKVDCWSLLKQLQELINRGYLKKFILNLGQPSKVKLQKEIFEDQQQRNPASNALVIYRETGVIFGASPLEGTTSREKAIYIEARRSNYPTVLIGPPLFPSRRISFSEVDPAMCTSRTIRPNYHHVYQNLLSLQNPG